MAESAVVRHHLIDPEICIRCNTCEATCPVGAITHDTRNYVVDVAKCNLCVDCIPPCPTGSIDNWRRVPRVRAYSAQVNATLPPWSVAHPYNHLYGPKATDKHVVAAVVGNFRVTQVGRE